VHIRPILRGLKTYVVRNPDLKGTGGTISARYCYSVWLRHLVQAAAAGVTTDPRVVAELGPGDSLGIGLAALLTGADRYHALDVVEHASSGVNERVLEELILLLHARPPIPGPEEFPAVLPLLESYEFPRQILSADRLARSLRPERIAAIRAALASLHGPDRGTAPIQIRYSVPWYDPRVIQDASIEMLYSQATLEHVEDLERTYQAMARWVIPGGVITHQVDFKSHGMTSAWNGHWEYPESIWRIVKGRRSFLLNRRPWSAHLASLEANGFEVLRVVRSERHDGLRAAQLAAPFRVLSDEDATTAGAFFVARKRT
jgi:hypothetical protein